MRSVGLKILKNKLSEYVRLAAGGEIVLVTDRDRVVAQLGPPQARGPAVSDAYLAQAVRDGVITPPMIIREEPPPSSPVASLDEVLRGLDKDRADR